MAIIGVNQAPREQVQQPQESEVDKTLNRILAAVQIANQGFGFALKFDEQDRLQAQTALASKQAAAVPTPEQVQQTTQADLQLKGLQQQKEQSIIGKTVAETEKIKSETPTLEQAQQARERRLKEEDIKLKTSEAQLKNLENEPAIKAADSADKLRTELNRNPITAVTMNLSQQVRPIDAYYSRIKNGGNPDFAGDQALIKIREKILDQGSVVRDSEFDLARKGGTLYDATLGAILERIKSGAMLTEDQRDSLFKSVSSLWNAQLVAQRSVNSKFEDLARRRNISPKDVNLDLGEFETSIPLPEGEPQPGMQVQQQGAEQSQSPFEKIAPPAFSEGAIKKVMDTLGVDRQNAIMRLNAAGKGGK